MSAFADSLVSTHAERRCLEALREVSGEVDGPMERHCARCHLLCERLAGAHGVEIDREVVLCAALLHDAGLYPAVTHGGVYTDEGGELVMGIAKEAGWEDDRALLCAQACARHHKLRPQWKLGAEVELLRLADRIEVTAGISRGGLKRAEIRDVFNAVPRAGVYREIARLLWPVVRDRPGTLPGVFRD